ncbi:hypothetical protein ACWD3I_24030 [Streptomyces sp. NPDC002817]|uniref:hypothetical protein n=1 Tax=Streptomyces sp. NPDC088357 TaxID=3154655 RepID=UPI00343757B0
MDLTADAFPSTFPVGILVKLLGRPERADRFDESLSWKRTCSTGGRSFPPSRDYGHDFRGTLSPAVLDVADAQADAQDEVVRGNPGAPVWWIRATAVRAPFERVRSRAQPHACPAAYRAEFGLSA